MIPDPIKTSAKNKFRVKGRVRKIRDNMNVKIGNVIEIASARVAPNSLCAVKYAVSPIT